MQATHSPVASHEPNINHEEAPADVVPVGKPATDNSNGNEHRTGDDVIIVSSSSSSSSNVPTPSSVLMNKFLKIPCGPLPSATEKDQNRRFPCCIVWTPLGCLTWIFPFVGHMGICDSAGVCHDFAGSRWVNKDQLAFGKATRFYPIVDLLFPAAEGYEVREVGGCSCLCCSCSSSSSCCCCCCCCSSCDGTNDGDDEQRSDGDQQQNSGQHYFEVNVVSPSVTSEKNYNVPPTPKSRLAAFDQSLKNVTQHYTQSQEYHFFCNNCHSFTASVLDDAIASSSKNEEGKNGEWSMVHLAARVLFFGRFVSVTAMLATLLPFVIVAVGIGILVWKV